MECKGEFSCVESCGYVISPGFPYNYYTSQKCSWKITVDTNAYIKLTIEEFDVFEDSAPNCQRDYVEIIDIGNDNSQTILGTFCNTYKPPKVLYSSWNQMKIDFFSDATDTAKGFRAKYDEISNTASDDIAWEEDTQGNFIN